MRRRSPKPPRPSGSISRPPRPATPRWRTASRATRQTRGAGWTTREEPLDLVEALGRRSAARPGRARRLPDPVDHEPDAFRPRRRSGDNAARRRRSGALGGPAILVSNEVGLGIVPENRLGRDFRDLSGSRQRRARARLRRRRVPRRRPADPHEARAPARLASSVTAGLRRFARERGAKKSDQQQRCDGPVKPDVVEATKGVDQKQKDCDGDQHRRSRAAAPCTSSTRKRGRPEPVPGDEGAQRPPSSHRAGMGVAAPRAALENAIACHRIDDVFQVLLAEAVEPNRQLVVHLIVDRTGDQDSPGSARSCKRAAIFTPSP